MPVAVQAKLLVLAKSVVNTASSAPRSILDGETGKVLARNLLQKDNGFDFKWISQRLRAGRIDGN